MAIDTPFAIGGGRRRLPFLSPFSHFSKTFLKKISFFAILSLHRTTTLIAERQRAL